MMYAGGGQYECRRCLQRYKALETAWVVLNWIRSYELAMREDPETSSLCVINKALEIEP